VDKKRVVLPKDAFIDVTDVEGHRANNSPDDSGVGPDERQRSGQIVDPETDVEGHRAGYVGGTMPAPPAFGGRRVPGHGGELTDEDDVEGHRQG